jgi:hypothetical protein
VIVALTLAARACTALGLAVTIPWPQAGLRVVRAPRGGVVQRRDHAMGKRMSQ